MKKQYIYILIGIVVVLAVAFLYFYYPSLLSPSKAPSFDQKYSEAQKVYYSGDTEKAISQIESILPGAPSKAAEADAKKFLALAYATGDVKKSTDLFKEVAGNQAYPVLTRALALSNMADMFMLGSSRASSTLTQNIFSGEPYKSYPIASTGEQRFLSGARKLYEQASALYVLPVDEYRIAEWYAKEATLSKLYHVKTSESADLNISQAKAHLTKGDNALAVYMQIGTQSGLGYSGWMQGLVLGMLGEFDKKDSEKVLAEKAFESAIATLKNTSGTGPYKIQQQLWANFSYASFLERAYGKARIADIKPLTAFITDPQNRFMDAAHTRPHGLIKYLTRLGAKKPTGMKQGQYDYENILALAKLDPAFASFLKELGWKL